MAARKKPPAKRPVAKVDLAKHGARVVSVFGPFSSSTLIELPTDRAQELFAKPLGASGPSRLVESLARELKELGKRDKELPRSSLASLAVALAYEIEHPYNSATSKAACARTLLDALEQLRSLAPKAEEKDRLDDLGARRAKRVAGGGAA